MDSDTTSGFTDKEFEFIFQYYIVEMPDGSKYSIPLCIILKNRAEYYASIEYDGDILKSLLEDTIPCCMSNQDEIEDWASNNMDWKDVEKYAVKIADADRSPMTEDDFQDGWVNGKHDVSKKI